MRELFISVVVTIVAVAGINYYTNNQYKKIKNETEQEKQVEKEESNEIPDDYIAVFNGGAGEITYSTYIYKINNGQANYGFKYINTMNHTVSWGSSEWTSTVTGKGNVDWTDDVFSVAQKNGAYSYVRIPNSDKIYTIEEYMNIFLMN